MDRTGDFCSHLCSPAHPYQDTLLCCTVLGRGFCYYRHSSPFCRAGRDRLECTDDDRRHHGYRGPFHRFQNATNSDETVVKFKITYAESNEQTLKYEGEEFTYNGMLYVLNKDAGRTQTTVYLLKDGKANYTLNYYGNFDKVFETVSGLISENI